MNWKWLSLLLAVGLAVACETESGNGSLATNGDTADTSPADASGDGTSTDLVSDTVGQEVAVPSDTVTGGEPCDEFCADLVAACPEQDTMQTCLHSCEVEATVAPGTEALACASAAATCDQANKCWSFLFN